MKIKELKRKHWFLLFLILIVLIALVLAFLNPLFSLLLLIGQWILFGLVTWSFYQFPDSEWTKWWYEDWVENVD